MDSRSAAHTLTHIASFLELHGEDRFKVRAYQQAARAVQALDTDDLRPTIADGTLAAAPGIGPAMLGVLTELVETGHLTLLERLRESTPEGLLEMLRVPGLGPAKIHQIHAGLEIETLQELEAAARDGRLASLPRFGPKTAEKILKGIAFLKETGALVLYPHGLAEGERLLAAVRQHPEVERAELAGSLRRRRETVCDVDIVAACPRVPELVAASFAHLPGVRQVTGGGTRSVSIQFVDGTRLDLHCVTPARFAVALWRATGSAEHVEAMRAAFAARGLTLVGDELRDGTGAAVPIPDERALYASAGLAYVPPELREGRGETEAAARDAVPRLVEVSDIQGVLHCHSNYSDGRASILEMAQAAQARGWSYLGITDHSQSAFYAGGVTREQIVRQHAEIDEVNAALGGFRVLKGIEADILPDGRLDYDDAVLDRFDFVIGSIHSRFGMDERTMTDRVLTALDDPHLTVLGHPTGRLLLTREPYAIDMNAVLEKAGALGVAVELNADPHRLDIDWRLLPTAKRYGALIEIGPDAHSPQGLDNLALGVGVARKGWLEAADVLNARSADALLDFAARRRGAA